MNQYTCEFQFVFIKNAFGIRNQLVPVELDTGARVKLRVSHKIEIPEGDEVEVVKYAKGGVSGSSSVFVQYANDEIEVSKQAVGKNNADELKAGDKLTISQKVDVEIREAVGTIVTSQGSKFAIEFPQHAHRDRKVLVVVTRDSVRLLLPGENVADDAKVSKLELAPAVDKSGMVLHYCIGDDEDSTVLHTVKNFKILNVLVVGPKRNPDFQELANLSPPLTENIVQAAALKEEFFFVLMVEHEPPSTYTVVFPHANIILDSPLNQVFKKIVKPSRLRDHRYFQQNFRISQSVEVLGAQDHHGVIVAYTYRPQDDTLRFLVLSKDKITELTKSCSQHMLH